MPNQIPSFNILKPAGLLKIGHSLGQLEIRH